MSAAPLAATRAPWSVQTALVARRWLVDSTRMPWGLGVTVIQPLIWIVLFGNVFRSVAQVPGFGQASYLTFLVPGILMMTMLYSGAWAGTGFIDDIRSGGPGGMAIALVASLLLAAAFCSVSAAVALTARDQTALIGISTLVVLPATFLSTALMPVALLPHWVEATARFNPLTWATEIARTAMSTSLDGGVVASRGLLLVASAAVTYAWSVAAMRTYQKSL